MKTKISPQISDSQDGLENAIKPFLKKLNTLFPPLEHSYPSSLDNFSSVVPVEAHTSESQSMSTPIVIVPTLKILSAESESPANSVFISDDIQAQVDGSPKLSEISLSVVKSGPAHRPLPKLATPPIAKFYGFRTILLKQLWNLVGPFSKTITSDFRYFGDSSIDLSVCPDPSPAYISSLIPFSSPIIISTLPSAPPLVHISDSIYSSNSTSNTPSKEFLENADSDADSHQGSIHGQPLSYLLVTIGLFSFLVISAICLSFLHLHIDAKHCRMSYMSPSFTHLSSFNSTRLTSKYSLYLYREQQVDTAFDSSGIPVIFIPGNAGSFRQVRALAAASSVLHYSAAIANPSKSNSLLRHERSVKFDYFTVDFQEDLTAFHGKSLYDQAEYLNDAILYILSLYALPGHVSDIPDYLTSDSQISYPPPSSVILIGHSMGGVVARTMLTLENYQKGSVNTIFTLSAPHTLAPVSFDKDIVNIYDKVNRYWEQSFSQDYIGRNPLASVSLISIAGGGLDHMITSESTSISSIVPPSNGFTVYANSVPHVWSGIDHQAIVWCDQFRMVFSSAMREVANVRVSAKTKPLTERMSIFRKHFLGGFEMGSSPNYLDMKFHPSVGGAQKVKNETFSPKELQAPDTLLWLEDITKSTISSNQKLVVDNIGSGPPNARIVPIPPDSGGPKNAIFSLLTDLDLVYPGSMGFNLPERNGNLLHSSSPFNYKSGQARPGLYALVCRYPHKETKFSALPLEVIDLTRDFNLEVDRTQLVGLLCKNIASDTSKMPKTSNTDIPFSPPSQHEHLLFAQYDVLQLVDYDMIVIVDTNDSPTPGFVVAEFSSKSSSSISVTNSLIEFYHGVSVSLPASRPMMIDISYNSIWSSLLAFRAKVFQPQSTKEILFKNFIRQYSGDNYYSKYFLNVHNSSVLDISIFGVAPFSPFGVREYDDDFEGNLFYYGQQSNYYHNLHLQVWSDGSTEQALKVILELDIAGSLGKLVLHYRTAVVVLPIVIIALVMRVQFKIFATSGDFISFIEGLRIFVHRHLFQVLLITVILPYLLQWPVVRDFLYIIEPDMDFISGDGPSSIFTNIRRNQFFLGLEPGHIWFLGPVFLSVSVGLCFFMFYLLSFMVQFLGNIYIWVHYLLCLSLTVDHSSASDKTVGKELPDYFESNWTDLKIIGAIFLYCTISLIAPYELIFILASIIQLFTVTITYTKLKAKPKDFESKSFFNLAISILMIMFLIMPIVLPKLVVWLRELANLESLPLYSYRNAIAICPILWLVRTMRSRDFILTQPSKTLRIVTETILIYIAFYALVFGIPRAYMLYHLFNVLCGWLVTLQFVNPKEQVKAKKVRKSITSSRSAKT